METARNRDALLLFISGSPFQVDEGGSDFLSCLSVPIEDTQSRSVQKHLSGFLSKGCRAVDIGDNATPKGAEAMEVAQVKACRNRWLFICQNLPPVHALGRPTQQSIRGLVALSTRCRSIWVPVISSGFLTCLGAYRDVASPRRLWDGPEWDIIRDSVPIEGWNRLFGCATNEAISCTHW
jgi:hypothetical protein